jgi:hypothetical protein
MKNKNIMIILITVFWILLSCSKINIKDQKTVINEDSIKSLILEKEKITLDRWYNGDPLGFIDNSWQDVTYFDASVTTRVDSLEAFRNLLMPLKGLIHIPIHNMEKPLVQVFGDIAILTFTDLFTIGENKYHWHATEIYQHRNNDWKLIHSHWTESRIRQIQ